MHKRLTQVTWPSWGPSFNTWYSEPVLFARLLAAATDLNWWIASTSCKYVTQRIDARNARFVLKCDGEGNSFNVISPDFVLDLILNRIIQFDKDYDKRISEATTIEELVLIVEGAARQHQRAIDILRKPSVKAEIKLDNAEQTIPLTPNSKPVYVEVASNVIGEVAFVNEALVNEAFVVVASTISVPWDRKYPLETFSKINKYRHDLDGNKIWNAIGVSTI